MLTETIDCIFTLGRQHYSALRKIYLIIFLFIPYDQNAMVLAEMGVLQSK